MTVTKLQIDVLVQAAMFGPIGAKDWTPLAKDADALGCDLLSTGRRVSGERNGEDYVFEPLPIGITAVEAIKACKYYDYQRAKTPAIVHRIIDRMLDHLDGMKDAPWGWWSDDIAAREGRPAPGSDLPLPPSAALTEVLDRLSAVGISPQQTTAGGTHQLDVQVGGAGQFHGSISALYVAESPRTVTQVHVIVAKTPRIAGIVFTYKVGGIVSGRSHFNEVRRIGNLLVLATLEPTGGPGSAAAVALDRLGTADDLWSATGPPLESGPGVVLGNCVDMQLKAAVVATSQADLNQLLSFLPDPDVQDQIRGVDLRAHSVLAAPGLEVGKLVDVELVRSTSEGKMTEDLVINHVPSTEAPIVNGSLVIIPRLRRRPAYVRGATPNHIGRFSGWWSPIESLRTRKSAS